MNKAYKVKNEIVSLIQKHNGLNEQTLNEIQSYMTKVSYRTSGKCDSDEKGFTASGTTINNDRALFCVKTRLITDYSVDGASSVGQFPDVAYYQIKVFFSVDLPVLHSVFTYRVTGSTKKMYYPVNLSGL